MWDVLLFFFPFFTFSHFFSYYLLAKMPSLAFKQSNIMIMMCSNISLSSGYSIGIYHSSSQKQETAPQAVEQPPAESIADQVALRRR
jgi:hypothetical protein